MLSKKQLSEIQKAVHAVESNSLTKGDVKTLLINLRSLNNSVVVDLANFIAHPEGRDRGTSHEEISKYVDAFLEKNDQGGGKFPGSEIIFTNSKIILALRESLDTTGVTYTKKSIQERSKIIISLIKEIVHESDFIIQNDRVAKCYVATNPTTGGLEARIHFKGGLTSSAITSDESSAFVFPLFE